MTGRPCSSAGIGWAFRDTNGHPVAWLQTLAALPRTHALGDLLVAGGRRRRDIAAVSLRNEVRILGAYTGESLRVCLSYRRIIAGTHAGDGVWATVQEVAKLSHGVHRGTAHVDTASYVVGLDDTELSRRSCYIVATRDLKVASFPEPAR